MKAGIVTIKEIDSNFGNSLQNYASQYILSKLGIEAVTLAFNYTKKNLNNMLVAEWLQRNLRYKVFSDYDYWRYDAARFKRFNKFNKRYIPSEYVKDIESLNEKYDFFCVGSDQVWNVNWCMKSDLMKKMYFLQFTDPVKKVCMVPSFGVTDFSDELEDFLRMQLSTFPNLCAREKSGVDLIKRLTGRDAEVLIDPTLMLTADEWKMIEKKPKNIDTDSNYILTYFLGSKTNNQEEYIKNIAAENNMKIYNLLDKNNYDLYLTDPSEFIYLVRNSSLIMTDSFHACVFSFIFEKPFQVFNRNGVPAKMFSRIENLLDLFDLQRKNFDNREENNILESDYRKGFETLKKERDRFNNFMKRSFKI